jgi:hypothetical protein
MCCARLDLSDSVLQKCNVASFWQNAKFGCTIRRIIIPGGIHGLIALHYDLNIAQVHNVVKKILQKILQVEAAGKFAPQYVVKCQLQT